MKCYTTLINNLKIYRPRLSMNDINLDFLRAYERYCVEKKDNGLQNAHKNLKYLKAMLNRALMNGQIKDTSYQHFKIKQFEGHRDFLTPDELETLNTLYWSGTLPVSHSNVLRYFLFSCYTGLRYRDLRELKFKDIYEATDETGQIEKTIRIKQHKTRDLVTIPLVIADGLRLLPETGFAEQAVFHVRVGQYGNRILEKIMVNAEINKTITMHCARHTFATIALIKGIRLDFVSKFLGHKNLRVTAIYAKYVDPTLIKEMRKWDAKP
jgi:integrase